MLWHGPQISLMLCDLIWGHDWDNKTNRWLHRNLMIHGVWTHGHDFTVCPKWTGHCNTAYFSHSQNKFTTHSVLANQRTVFTEWRHPLTADVRRPDAVTKAYGSGFSPWCTAFHNLALFCKHRWESGLASTFSSKKINQMVRILWSFQIVIWHAVFYIIR